MTITKEAAPRASNRTSPISRTFTTNRLLSALDSKPDLTAARISSSTSTVPRNCASSSNLQQTAQNHASSSNNEEVELEQQPDVQDNHIPKDGTEAEKALEVYSYKSFKPTPALVYTRLEDEADDLVQLLRPGPIGFDMEWRVNFHRGKAPQEFKTAVIQVCDEHIILVIQISAMKTFPKELKRIIEDKGTIKLGANILNDGQKLRRDYQVYATNLVELGQIALQADPNTPYKRKIVSLAKITELYCGKTLAKGKERTGNWEALLNNNMREYAGNDAHCALMSYNKLLQMAEDAEITLNPTKFTSHVNVTHPATPTTPLAAEENEAPTTTSTESNASTSATVEVVVELPVVPHNPRVKLQHMRAFYYWKSGISVPIMCKKLSLKGEDAPIKPGTVVSYIIGALQADSSLEFDAEQLALLAQQDRWVWKHHRAWIKAKQLLQSQQKEAQS